MGDGARLAIVGATGAVGKEMLQILEERNFPLKDLILVADPTAAGSKIRFKGEDYIVRTASDEVFKESDMALFAVGTDVSKDLAPQAVKNNCVVIDNSYAFRLEDHVPLVVPEVNAEDIEWHKGIIANPNCSTIIMTVAIFPIFKAVGLKRVIVSTYQAVSGAGLDGIDELDRQTQDYIQNKNITSKVFQHQITCNLIPHIDTFVEDDYTKEEMKMVWETRKIMHCPELKIAATAVRVPVYRSHSESINVETEKEISAEEVRNILKQSPGIIVQDDPQNNVYPMPLYSSHTDAVYVGRIRKDLSSDRGIAMWVVADQIRKGAATNAIQIAEIVYNKNLF